MLSDPHFYAGILLGIVATYFVSGLVALAVCRFIRATENEVTEHLYRWPE